MKRLALAAIAMLAATPADAATVLAKGTYSAGEHVSAYSEQANYAPPADYFFRLRFTGTPPFFGFLDDPVIISGLGDTYTRMYSDSGSEYYAIVYNAQACCGYHINFQAFDGLGDGSWTLTRERLWQGTALPQQTAALAMSASMAAGAVPEPATWGMMLFGFAAVGAAARTRRRAAA